MTNNLRMIARTTLFGLLIAPIGMGCKPDGERKETAAAMLSSEVFTGAVLVRSEEQHEPTFAFDPSALPSDYKTCYRESVRPRLLTIERPYDGASFPCNIAPPLFRWTDQTSTAWLARISVPGREAPIETITTEPNWRLDKTVWDSILEGAAGQMVKLEVLGTVVREGRRAGKEVYTDSVEFRISPYPADPAVVYRMVTPVFHGLKAPDIYRRELSTFRTDLLLPGAERFCTNCHSFPNTPNTPPEQQVMAIAVRDQSLSAPDGRQLGIYDFTSRKGQQVPINSFFMSWNPTIDRVAVTRGPATYSRPRITLETQEFHVFEADIEIVDRATGEHALLPGACLPDQMECFPTWSPDGKTIMFSRAPEFTVAGHLGGDDEEEQTADIQYNLYTVPYNDGKGGEAVPVAGASHNGKSNFAARYSPDGRWVAFCMADCASLVEPTADLWIMPADGSAPPRELECNVDYAMDSHHSWSSNSRWLLFATKRDDGIFARVYMVEIDENGHAWQPVEMPTLEPTMYCYNVPEFMSTLVELDAQSILIETTYPEEERQQQAAQ